MKLGHVIHYVPDVTEAVAFYEHAFGVAHVRDLNGCIVELCTAVP